MPLKKIFLNGVLWSFIQQFSTQLATFIIQLVLVRFISPADFGLVGMLAIFIGIGSALFDGGMTSSLIRNNQSDDSDYSTVFYYNLICSVILYLVLYICAPFIADFFNQQILVRIARLYGLTFIFSAFGAVQNTILIKSMRFKAQAILSIPPLIFGGIVGVFLAVNSYGVWALVYSMLITSFFNSFLLWIFSRWKPSSSFNIYKFKYHFNYGYKMSISSILDNVFTNIYQIVIGKLYNPTLVGYYSRANSLMMLPVGNISIVLNRVVFPLFSKVQNDTVALKGIYKKILQIIFFIISPTIALMILLSKEIVLVFFTEKWLSIVPIFKILCLSGLFYPLHLYNLMILQVKGKSGLFLKLEILKKVIVILSLIISIKYGFYGILVGSVITSFIGLFINTHYAGKFLEYKMYNQLKDLLPIFFSAIIMSFIVFILKYLFDNYSPISTILLSCTLGIISYVIFSYIFKIQSLIEIILIIKNYGKRN